jgi:hypothetical protein
MVDEEALADPRGGVDLDAGPRAREDRQRARRDRDADPVQPVGDAVREHRLHAGPGRQDLDAADPVGGGIARVRGGDVAPHLAHDARQGAEAEHGTSVLPRRRALARVAPLVAHYGAKKGIDM